MIYPAPAGRPCPLCNADNRRQPAGVYSSGKWTVKTCPRCGLTYLENPPSYTALAGEFAWEKTSIAEEQRRREARPVSKRLSSAFKTFRKRILRRDKLLALIRQHVSAGPCIDLGCSAGGVLERLPASLTPFGIEISPVLAREADLVARSRGGHVVCASCVDGLPSFPDCFFSGALLSAFLEHESQPQQLLNALQRTLQPGAAVIVKVPNFGSINRRIRGGAWCGFRFPDHVSYFTSASLARMARNCGYHVVRCTIADQWPFSDNLWMVLGNAR